MSDSARYMPSSSESSHQPPVGAGGPAGPSSSDTAALPYDIPPFPTTRRADTAVRPYSPHEIEGVPQHPSPIPLVIARVIFGVFLFLGLSLRSLWLRDFVLMKDLSSPLPFLDLTLGSFALPIVLSTVICILWLAGRLLERPLRGWQWGSLSIFLPLFGLSLIVLANLRPDRATGTSLEIPKLLAFTWFVYLFVVNERPRLTVPLALAITVQGTVAVWQFLTQSDLGLQAIGERHLATEVDGISILWVQDHAWIRPYGLTDHPNWLGATLSICILILLSAFERLHGARQWAIGAAIVVAFLGLLVSFSRAAWIGFAVGLLLHAVWRLRSRKGSAPVFPHARVLGGALILLAFLFLVPYRDLVVSRVVLGDNPVELRSVTDRLRDARIALELIADHPWRGIGTGEFMDSARALDPEAITVHNVTLLVAAETGLPGLAFWLSLVAGSLLIMLRELGRPESLRAPGDPPPAMVWLPPWITSLVIGMFDPNPWPILMLTSALLFGLMTGSLAMANSTTETQRTQRVTD